MRSRLTTGMMLGVVMFLACTGAFAQFSFNWYVDDGFGSPGYVTDSDTVTRLAQGLPVYLMWAGNNGTVEGINSLGQIQGDDAVALLDMGGTAQGSIGDVDFFPFAMRDEGEFYLDHTLAATYESGAFLYVLAFNSAVSYNGVDAFLGTGYYGVSTAYLTDGNLVQTNDFLGWSTSNALIPEPTTLALLGAGLAGIVAYRRKRQTSAVA